MMNMTGFEEALPDSIHLMELVIQLTSHPARAVRCSFAMVSVMILCYTWAQRSKVIPRSTLRVSTFFTQDHKEQGNLFYDDRQYGWLRIIPMIGSCIKIVHIRGTSQERKLLGVQFARF